MVLIYEGIVTGVLDYDYSSQANVVGEFVACHGSSAPKCESECASSRKCTSVDEYFAGGKG